METLIQSPSTKAMEQILANAFFFTNKHYHSYGTKNFDPKNPGSFERIKIPLPQSLIRCSTKLFEHLDVSEFKVVNKICHELCHNNALWSYEIDSGSEEDINAIQTLILKKILIRTESRNIYIVNPFAIRHGKISNVISATTEILEKNLSVCKKMIKNIRPSKGYKERLYRTELQTNVDSEISDLFTG